MEATCNYCLRTFSSNNEIFNRHKLCCMFIHTSLKEKTSNFESFDVPLNESQRDSVLRKLLIQVAQMNEKMTKMQIELQSLKNRHRKQIISVLNSLSVQPSMHVFNWIKSVSVSQCHLDLAIKHSLYDGIRQVFVDALQVAKTLGSNVPIRAYTEKKKCIFIYFEEEGVKKWVICDHATLKKMCVIFASRIIERFISIQTEMNNDDNHKKYEEDNMHIMQKIMDNNYTQTGNISKLLCDIQAIIQVDFVINTYE